MMGMEGTILDRIAFGSIKDSVEFVDQDETTNELVLD